MIRSHSLSRWASACGAALMVALAPAAVHAQSQVQITDAQGARSVPAKPAKTVVMDLAVLDTLHTLGVDVAGVPASVHWPKHLAQFGDKRYPKVGSMFEPDYEAINKLKPQLIFVAGRSAPKFADLARLAPTVDLTVKPGDLVGSVERNARLVASIYGKEAEADARLGALKQSIAALREQGAQAGTGLIVLTTGGKMSAYGPGSRFGVIHDAFGVKPAAADLKVSNHGQAVSFEFIAQTNPDWLFVIDRDAAIGREGVAARQMLDNDLVRGTTAWKQKQVVYLDGSNWYSLGAAGLTSLRQSVDEVAAALAAKR